MRYKLANYSFPHLGSKFLPAYCIQMCNVTFYGNSNSCLQQTQYLFCHTSRSAGLPYHTVYVGLYLITKVLYSNGSTASVCFSHYVCVFSFTRFYVYCVLLLVGQTPRNKHDDDDDDDDFTPCMTLCCNRSMMT